MYASLNGHVEVVDKLLQHGATVDLQKEVHTLYVHTQCSLLEKPAPAENAHGILLRFTYVL